jgi:RES domain
MNRIRKSVPSGFGSSTLVTRIVAPGDFVWHRVYSSAYLNPLGFGYGSSRFSDPRTNLPETDRFGVLYFGESIEVCFLEAILRDTGNGRVGDLPIANSELTQRLCAVIEVREPLTLVDLRNGGPVVMRVPTDAVRASSHRWGQKWSHAFWSHRDSPDGLIYPSRLNEQTNVALYNRALHKVAAPAGGRPLLDWALEMAAIIRKYKLSLVR